MRLHVSLIPFILLTGGAANPHTPILPKRNPIAPIANIIAKGEGDWDSVNRGRAGDTPGGIKSITGKSLSDYTVGEVQALQRTSLFAVGRYQFIPSTLAFAVERAGVKASEQFTPEVQDRLLRALIYYKRPEIGGYLRGDHDNLELALDELAKEWASIAAANGSSYYAGQGGNGVHVTRDEAAIALRQARGLV